MCLSSPTVAAVSAALFGELNEDSCEDDAARSGTSFREAGDDPADWVGNERTARREACCLDDAVFSRTPNWVGRDFMFLRQSL